MIKEKFKVIIDTMTAENKPIDKNLYPILKKIYIIGFGDGFYEVIHTFKTEEPFKALKIIYDLQEEINQMIREESNKN